MPALNMRNIWNTKAKDAANNPKKDAVQTAWEDWKTAPDNMNKKQQLLESLQPTIDSAINSYAPDSKDRVRTKAALIALKAATTYNANAGTALKTHVFNNLKSLNRINAQLQNIVHIPEAALLEKGKMDKFTRDYVSENDREPTTQELSELTRYSPDKIEYLRQYKQPVAQSQLLTEKGDTLFTKKQDPQKIWSDYVYHDMDPIDKKIFEWSTGYKGSPKLKKIEIAANLKISPPAVSQRINKIITKLEEGVDL